MNHNNSAKTIFLTSSPDASYQVDGEWVTGPFTSKNGFLKQFRQACQENPRVLLITATPDDPEKNQEMAEYFTRVFAASEIAVKTMRLLERTTMGCLAEWLAGSDVVILGGGHVPTQNRFFRQIGLRERLQDFGGVIMGISAGSMNCAEVVYAQPELSGEASDPKYERFLPGLGLTHLQILPHYQMVKDYMLDGRRLMEGITYPDSVGHKFYALEDGSYIMSAGGREVLYGNAFLIAGGKLTPICKEGRALTLTDN
ncbi:MAG: type 1 glutamine amidotransferase-like domain-containing protein [Lachnospiraceae bacterium]|nr:type 1 glutamine amidotransferase-like domain-containing protein [Lachnospiraceae bacterium]